MTQDSLFDAAVYVRRAYDQLVLATEYTSAAELESLKWQTLQAWLSMQLARLEQPAYVDQLDLEDMPA